MKNLIYALVIILIIITSTLPVAAGSNFLCALVIEIPPIECNALVALYNSTNGPGWTNHNNWLVTYTPSNWHGVDVTSGHVTTLQLYDNQLNGNIPTDLGNLTSLTTLQLAYNMLTGSIPIELTNLTNLTSLYLDINQLSGGIPQGLGNLTNLVTLSLRDNQLSGVIPPELSNLINLQYLELNNNQLSGSIPPQLGNLINLNQLFLSFNQLSGNIPIQLGNFGSMVILHLSDNQLTGSIPPELGNLTNLKGLHLGNNQLNGSIPSSISNLFNLQTLNLCGNQLIGNLLPELGNMPKLSLLYLCDNKFDGSIPPQLGNLTNLYILKLSNNQLSGNIPSELGNLNKLGFMILNDNHLTGSIPYQLGNITTLQILYLQDNRLDGYVPYSFMNLGYLCEAGQWPGYDCLDLDSNLLSIYPGYPDPNDPFQVFLYGKDPDWQLSQGFKQVIGVSGGELTSVDGRTGLLIPAGTLISDTTFTFIPHPTPHHDNAGLLFANNGFQLTAEDTIGNPITTFNVPITVTLNYSDTDIIGIIESKLYLYYWDTGTNTWLDAVTTCLGGEYTRYLSVNMFTLPLCHLTEFGVFGAPLWIFMPVINR